MSRSSPKPNNPRRVPDRVAVEVYALSLLGCSTLAIAILHGFSRSWAQTLINRGRKIASRK